MSERPVRERAATLRALADQRLRDLQRGYLARGMRHVATHAALRRAITSPIGEVPEIWEVTIAGTESVDDPGDRPEPTRAERALTLALCLYAINQRSQHSEGMHIRRLSTEQLEALKPEDRARRERAHSNAASFGRASARLRRQSRFNEEAVMRRFAALVTATDFDEIAYHLRSMVTQFNGERIGQDYARLASDLYLLQAPTYADSVRLRWGRDFHRPLTGERSRSDTGADTHADEASEHQTGDYK